MWHVMEESGSGESPCLQSPWSMGEEEKNNVLGWRWGNIWEGYIWGIWGIYGIYVYARISDLACMHGRIAKTETGVLVPLCDLGQGSPLSWAQSLCL